MTLALRRDPWGKPRDPLGNEAYSYRRFMAQQRDAMSGRWGRGTYTNSYRNAFGREGFGIQAPRTRRPAYSGGSFGGFGSYNGYGGYGSYGGRPYSPMVRFGGRATQFRRPYSRYPSWSALNYSGGLGGLRQQYQPRYRAFPPSPLRDRRRPYGRDQYYYDEDLSEDDYDESDFEDSYYLPPPRRSYRSYRDWGEGDEDDDDDDDDDDDEWDGYGFEEEEDSDFEEYDYDSDGYDDGRYEYGRGYRY
jgi:hypothetical protein